MTAQSFDFWHKWLLAASILCVAMGLLIALAPSSFLFGFHTTAMAETFFQGTMPEDADRLRTFLFAPLGGTIAGCFLLQTFIVWVPFYRREPWAWHAVLWAMLLWFVVDSGLSIHHGAFFNVWMVNIWALLLVGLPLAMTYKDFILDDATPHLI